MNQFFMSCSFDVLCHPFFSLKLEDETTQQPTAAATDDSGDKRRRLFSKELRCMMYGFGDDQNPYTESVDFLEDLVVQYVSEMVRKNLAC